MSEKNTLGRLTAQLLEKEHQNLNQDSITLMAMVLTILIRNSRAKDSSSKKIRSELNKLVLTGKSEQPFSFEEIKTGLEAGISQEGDASVLYHALLTYMTSIESDAKGNRLVWLLFNNPTQVLIDFFATQSEPSPNTEQVEAFQALHKEGLVAKLFATAIKALLGDITVPEISEKQALEIWNGNKENSNEILKDILFPINIAPKNLNKP